MKIFLDHGEAYQNLGDEAMLLSAINKFRDQAPQSTIVVPATSPELLPQNILNEIKITPSLKPYFERLSKFYQMASRIYSSSRLADSTKVIDYVLKLSDLTVPSLFQVQSKLAKEIKSADIFYGVGGAYFNDFYPPGLAYKRWMYNQLPSDTVSALSAQGFGPLNRRWPQKVAKEAIKNLDVVTFRDNSYSKEIINKLCPNTEQKIVGDEAFELNVGNDNRINEYIQSAGLGLETKFVAFHYRGTDYTQDTSHLVNKLSKVIDSLIDTLDIPVLYIPMSYGEHSGHDRKYGKKISQNVKSEKFHVGPESKEVKTVKGVLGKSALAVGLSYHFHVFALSQAIPSVVLYSGEYYRLKSEGLLGHYSLENYVLDIEQKSTREITESCSNIISSDEIDHIREKNEQLKNKCTWTTDRVLTKYEDKNSTRWD